MALKAALWWWVCLARSAAAPGGGAQRVRIRPLHRALRVQLVGPGASSRAGEGSGGDTRPPVTGVARCETLTGLPHLLHQGNFYHYFFSGW